MLLKSVPLTLLVFALRLWFMFGMVHSIWRTMGQLSSPGLPERYSLAIPQELFWILEP